MLTKNQEKLIRSLQTKKGREESGLCLAEGKKVIEMAGDLVEYTFRESDTSVFAKLVTTEAPQTEAAVVRIPTWDRETLLAKRVIVVLDGVQDPGNVGAILRLCLGFDAGLILIESADVTNPKVIRSSAGAMFKVPSMNVPRAEAENSLKEMNRAIYRLEKRKGSVPISDALFNAPLLLVAGSEGKGIQLDSPGASVHIEHASALESLNVANALAIALYSIFPIK
ncbi:MAG: RNA methyltransferase [Candidatus Uhrbacteria bacterium]|nr:RNA methyltransferase [Candidatus Uhrbacteria bacterium]